MKRRDQVLEVAIQLVAEGGTYELTHRKVDAMAGVPPGTTSNFFPNRKALLLAVVHSVAEPMAERAAQNREFGEGTAEELVHQCLRERAERLLGPLRLHGLVWWRCIVEGAAEPEVHAAVAATSKEIYAAYGRLLRHCGSTDPERHAALLGAYLGTLVLQQNLASEQPLDLDRAIAPMARGVAHAIRRDREGADGTP